MKKIFNIIIAALTLTAVGCQTTEEFVREVNSDRVVVETNRRGIDSNGGQIILNITANTYWMLNVDDAAASWVEFTPKAAPAGETEVFVTIAENSDAPRTATLSFDTLDGVIHTITINQKGADEHLSYYCESFGDQPVAEDTNINRFDNWATTGFGSNLIVYDGDASITAQNPATVDGTSAGNSLYFGEDNLEVVIGPIGIYGDEFPHRWLPGALAIVDEAFTEKNGLVNSTMKIVRNKVEAYFKDRIEDLYTPEGKKLTSEKNITSLKKILGC